MRPRDFWKERAITFANVNQARGNEADFVYVVGIRDSAADALNVQSRNVLFIAMSRTKGWVSLPGTGDSLDLFYQKILQLWKMLKEDPFKITFQYRGKPKYPLAVELAEDQARLPFEL